MTNAGTPELGLFDTALHSEGLDKPATLRVRSPSVKLRAFCRSNRHLEEKVDLSVAFKKSTVVTAPAWIIQRKPNSGAGPKLAELQLTTQQKLGMLIQTEYPSHLGWSILKRAHNPRTKVDSIEMYNKQTGRMDVYFMGKHECANATKAAYRAVYGADGAIATANEAWQAYLAVRTRRSVLSCGLKLILYLRHVRRVLEARTLREIQARVEQLIKQGGGAPDIEVDLVRRNIGLKQQIQFEGGCAVIKQESAGLMHQISLSLRSICTTCGEFGRNLMQFRVEGHTAVSKKSPDGGIATSIGRSRAVVEKLIEEGIPAYVLHPKGFGDSRPIGSKDQNRRVEIHVIEEKKGAPC
jgi:flagellar motor protein MotB